MKRFIKCKRGLSTVIGAVFCVLVILMGFSFILWEANQYDSYIDAVNERTRLDQEQANEMVAIGDSSIAGDDLNFSVINTGAVTAHLVSLWVTEYSGTTANWHVGPISISNYLNPGSTTIITETIEGVDPDLNYLIKIVTERGNVAKKLYEPGIQPGTGGEFIGGPFLLEFSAEAFRYTSDNNPASPATAFEIDNDRNDIVFWIKFNNRATRGIQISQHSFFLVVVRDLESQGNPGNMEYERYFHVVDPTSDSSGLDAYSPDYMQTIPSGEDATLKFGAETVGGTSFLGSEPLHASGDDFWENLLWTFIVIFWRYEPTIEDPNPPTFGQTIAYAAIRSTA